jgi:hypothetical protein
MLALRSVVTLLLLFCVGFTYAQQPGEKVSDLKYNAQLSWQAAVQRSLDQTYIYAVDTISLPFIDEFSTDKFKKYNSSPTDGNVSDTLFIALYDVTNTIVEPDTMYSLDTSYYYQHDSFFSPDTVIVTITPYASKIITVHDICNHPVTSQTDEVWPAYDVNEYTWNNIIDTIWHNPPDLVQDSARIYFVEATDTASLWVDNNACRNDNFPIAPPTIGVATLDGLDSIGYPHNFSTSNTYGLADHLTSKPIDLRFSPSNAFDSLYLSFYFQAGGHGREPEFADSLILEFWSPDSVEWYQVWSSPGIALDSFQQVMVPVDEPQYWKNGFQFRFSNYGSLAGNTDLWHVDYVILDSGRVFSDTIRQDLAFSEPIHTLLLDYVSMPWKHFRADPVNSMNQVTVNTQMSNLFTYSTFKTFFAVKYGQPLGDFQTQTRVISTAVGEIDYSHFSVNHFDSLFIAPFNYVYDTAYASVDTCAFIDACFYINNQDTVTVNDTLRFTQEFSNYYAYDDGSAERAWGVYGSPISPKVAYRFNAVQADSIRAVNIHFSPSVDDVSADPFLISIWTVGSDNKPGTLIHENISFQFPVYNIGKNGFYEYELDSTIAVPTSYFVGWTQTTVNRLNVGLDLNTDSRSRIYFDDGAGWENTTLPYDASLMIRPVYVTFKDIYLAVNEETPELDLNVYPNPTRDRFYIELPTRIRPDVQLFDFSGKLLFSAQRFNDAYIDVSDYPAGIYLLRVYDERGDRTATRKVVVQH